MFACGGWSLFFLRLFDFISNKDLHAFYEREYHLLHFSSILWIVVYAIFEWEWKSCNDLLSQGIAINTTSTMWIIHWILPGFELQTLGSIIWANSSSFLIHFSLFFFNFIFCPEVFLHNLFGVKNLRLRVLCSEVL